MPRWSNATTRPARLRVAATRSHSPAWAGQAVQQQDVTAGRPGPVPAGQTDVRRRTTVRGVHAVARDAAGTPAAARQRPAAAAPRAGR
ncbi:hypothetical protein GCM10020229_57950 [Kitasatospora albolonga]|uniref:hypothetical protein n=1 Tax=Kitasatospora albolonga TaxID=68173 RepID=UPI0031EB0A6B